jgi:metallophosphoesterase (TIGR00282 family)
VRILAIGDVIGKPGRKAVQRLVPGLRSQYDLDYVIANAENAAGGKGLTPATADILLDSGVDILTSGNHIWAQKEILPCLNSEMPLLRPLNYPSGVPGRGYLINGMLMVVNLLGRTFMGNVDCPFRTMDQLLESLEYPQLIIVVDFHAEATSEKNALGRHLDGRVAAVVGTHTHIGTVDTRILPGGTAYVTDIGMVGPMDSIIGDDIHSVLRRFLTQMPTRLSVGKGDLILNSVLIDIDDTTAKATDIKRLDFVLEENDES